MSTESDYKSAGRKALETYYGVWLNLNESEPRNWLLYEDFKKKLDKMNSMTDTELSLGTVLVKSSVSSVDADAAMKQLAKQHNGILPASGWYTQAITALMDRAKSITDVDVRNQIAKSAFSFANIAIAAIVGYGVIFTFPMIVRAIKSLKSGKKQKKYSYA